MQRVLAVLLVLLGLTGLVLGRLGETTWAPADETTATVDLSDAGPAVVIDPGVLYVGGEEGELVIEGASDVSVITAGNDDISAYLEDVHYTRITGASDWSTLSTEDVNPDGADELSDPTSSDLWRTVETAPSPYTLDIAEFRAGETGENEQVYRAILIVTDGTEPGASSVSITWPNDAENEWVPFAYAGGATLAVIGLVLLVVSLGGRRRDERDAELVEPTAQASAGLGAAAGTAGAAAVTTDADDHDAAGHDAARPVADARDADARDANARDADARDANARDADAPADDAHTSDQELVDQNVDQAAADQETAAQGAGDQDATTADGTGEDGPTDTEFLFGTADQGPRPENVWAPAAIGGAHTDTDEAETPHGGEDRTEQIDAVDDEEGRR